MVCALSSAPSPFGPRQASSRSFELTPRSRALSFAGLGAEATSERTLSFSGRVFSKLRRSMSMENLAAMVIGAAYPGVLTND
jgi:hypothetical protein